MGNPVTHFEIVGSDPKALQSFYRDAFGWEIVPAGPSYAMVHPQAVSR
jgi:predicted enzyme related to lactoylglutathione lyase